VSATLRVAAHYDVVGQALLETLATALGEKFTPEVGAAVQVESSLTHSA
jgi:hemoglobin-like flavoprotein